MKAIYKVSSPAGCKKAGKQIIKGYTVNAHCRKKRKKKGGPAATSLVKPKNLFGKGHLMDKRQKKMAQDSIGPLRRLAAKKKPIDREAYKKMMGHK